MNIIKTIFLLVLISGCFIACSPVIYQQIATLSSDNVELKKDGTFVYEDAMVTIVYDFWSESGRFYFIVTNNTDEDIYLNLSKSFFINNGYAYDYYQVPTCVYVYENNAASGSIETDSVGKLKQHNDSYTDVAASENIEYVERPLICVPAHSSKAFGKFSVASSVFRECGFIRDPSKNEIAVREYTGLTSPRIIENRLVFIFNDMTLPITNIFYVSEYMNIAFNSAMEYVTVKNCDGSKQNVKMHKMSANNKFYITYDSKGIYSAGTNKSDRETTPFFKSGRTFSDGIYN